MISRILALCFSILCLLALSIKTGELVVGGLILVIASLFLIGILCHLILKKHINCWIEAKNSTVTGNPITLHIHLNNTSHIPVLKGEVYLKVKNISFGVNQEKKLYFSLPGKCDYNLSYDIESDYCGKFEIEVCHIKIYDFWGILFYRLTKKDFHNAYSFPKYYYVNSVTQIMRVNYEKERYFANKKNTNLSDLLQYREYQKGDSIKHINWKLSNRFDEYIIREFDTPTDNQILVVFDTYGQNKYTKNMVFCVLMSIAMSYVKNNISHHITWYDKHTKSNTFKELVNYESVIHMLKEVLDSSTDETNSSIRYLIKRNIVSRYAKIIYITNELPDNIRKEVSLLDNVQTIFVEEETFKKGQEENVIRSLNL